MSKLLVAIDGGATKTDLVLCLSNGCVLNRIIGGSSNPNDIGFDVSVNYLKELLLKLLSSYGELDANIRSFYAGLSGGSVGDNKIRYYKAFRSILPNTLCINNDSDGINALTSGLGQKDGMVLIAGTGSVVFVRSNDTITQIGGWGYMLDDAGSGYDLGRNGFCAVLRAMDGRGKATLLTELYNKRLQKPVYTAIPEIYSKGKEYIASFSPLIFDAEAKGDIVARQIINTCAEELALLIKAGSKHIQKPPYFVVVAGGLWKAGEVLINKIKEFLNNDFEFIYPDLPPVYGASLEAAIRGGVEINSTFYKNYKNTLITKRERYNNYDEG